MPILRLQTLILAPPALCFDASRHIDLHIASMKHTGEKAVAGKISGLIGLPEAAIAPKEIWLIFIKLAEFFFHPHYYSAFTIWIKNKKGPG